MTELGLVRKVVIGARGTERVDAVVSLTGSPSEMADAVVTLRPGGIFYCEIDRARLRQVGWGPSRLRRHLRRSGVVTVAYWRRRRGHRDILFLPIDLSGAVPWYLRELADNRGVWRRLSQLASSAIIRQDGRRLGTVARRYSLTGVVIAREEAGHRQPPVTPGVLAIDSEDLLLPAMLTRGEGPWSRVVLLPFGRTDRQPRHVVKLPRTAEHNWATEREQQALSHVASLLPPDLARTIPAAKGIRAWSGLCVGTESFLPGRPLAFVAASSRDQSSCDAQLEGAVGWLIDVHLATRVGDVSADDPSGVEMLDEPLHRMAQLLHLSAVLDGNLLAERYGASKAKGCSIPVVWQHCDLTPHNVRWNGRCHSVVDWEAARMGPALCDLFYLLLHWNWDGMPPLGNAPAEVFRRVFMSKHSKPAAMASQQVHRYCNAVRVDLRLIEPLLVNMLSQQALDRADRIRDSGDDPTEDENLYAQLFHLVLGATGSVPAWAVT